MTELIVVVLVLAVAATVGILLTRRRSDAGAERPAETLEPTAPAELAPPVGAEMVLMFDNDGHSQLYAMVSRAEDALLADRRDSLSAEMPVLIRAALEAAPGLRAVLARGDVVRVVGPPHLLRGIQEGTFTQVTSAGGMLGVVKGPDGRFAGHLRFAMGQGARTPLAVAGPLLLLQMAAALQTQQQMKEILERLATIQRGIDDLKQMLRARTHASIITAESLCDDLENLARAGEPLLETQDHLRLQRASHEVQLAYNELREGLRIFARRVDQLVDRDGCRRDDVSRDQLRELLVDAKKDHAPTAVLFLEALVTRMRVLRLERLVEVEASPERAAAIAANVTRVVDEMRDDFEQAGLAFGRLNLRRDDAKGAHDHLLEYRAATKPLRAILRQPLRRVLPAPQQEDAYVIELRELGGAIQAAHARFELETATEGVEEVSVAQPR